MPLFEAKKFVLDSVESILNQTYPNITIYIIDDGSSDNGLEHLKSCLAERGIADSGVRMLKQNHRGVGITRRELFDWSRKENPHAYILWLDADDRFNSNEFVSSVISQMLGTQADMCLFNFAIEFEDPSQQANAMVLKNDKLKIAGILQAVRSAPGQCVNPVDLPNLLDFTSLGWTKCYGPRMSLPVSADCPYEDFVYMAALLQANRITALLPSYEPITYLRRSTSICGRRIPENFSHDIPVQLLKFFETVNNSHDPQRHQKLIMVQSFVISKLNSYQCMLQKFVADKSFEKIDESTLAAFNKQAECIKSFMQACLENRNETRLVRK